MYLKQDNYSKEDVYEIIDRETNHLKYENGLLLSEVDELKYIIDEKANKSTKSNTLLFIDNLDRPYNKYKKYYESHNIVIVKNYMQMITYLNNGGLPDIISIKYNLGLGQYNGADCAKYIKEYVSYSKNPSPKILIHSSNREESKTILNNI